MSQSPGTPGAPTLVLRLLVPAGEDFREIASELAVKVAEYVGCPGADTAKVAATLESLASEVVGGQPADADITFEFHQIDEELRIEARVSGRSATASHPLPDKQP